MREKRDESKEFSLKVETVVAYNGFLILKIIICCWLVKGTEEGGGVKERRRREKRCVQQLLHHEPLFVDFGIKTNDL